MQPILLAIADVLLPLEDWIKEPDKFIPKEPKPLKTPWRDQGSPSAKLSVGNLGFIAHFEARLTNDGAFIDAYDVDEFIERAAGLVDEPLMHCPLGASAMQDWRDVHGMKKIDSPVKFDASLSENFDFQLNLPNSSGIRRRVPVTRKVFYGRCFPQLTNAVALRVPSNRIEWAHLVADLKRDADVDGAPLDGSDPSPITGWSTPHSGVKASELIVALTRDIAVFVLTHRCENPDTSDAWKSALPIDHSSR